MSPVPNFGLPKPGRYKKLVKHRRRPSKETRAFSKNESKVVHVEKDGKYVKKNVLNGKYTRYTKSGKVAANQRF
jgi:hypothetical protein